MTDTESPPDAAKPPPDAAKTSDKSGKKKNSGKLGPLGWIYIIGFVATAAYYVIIGFDGCEFRTWRGRCFDFDTFIEGFVYGLIWPVHWIFEIIEALT